MAEVRGVSRAAVMLTLVGAGCGGSVANDARRGSVGEPSDASAPLGRDAHASPLLYGGADGAPARARDPRCPETAPSEGDPCTLE